MENCLEFLLAGLLAYISEPITSSPSFLWLQARSLGAGLGADTVGAVLYASYEETFVPHVGFRREQLITPWEVISHEWYFGKRDTGDSQTSVNKTRWRTCVYVFKANVEACKCYLYVMHLCMLCQGRKKNKKKNKVQ